MSTADQNDLAASKFAFPEARKEPLTDAAHVLVKAGVVGATGFEPVTSSVSATPREPLCGRPFLQVVSDRGCRDYVLTSRSVGRSPGRPAGAHAWTLTVWLSC
jgi:hypothetical protein